MAGTVHAWRMGRTIDRMASRVTRTTAFLWLLLLGLLPATAYALDPHQALDHYGHQVWRTDSGLPQNTVRALLQTSDGYLWLGTDGGLVRFDGIDFVTYDAENTPQFPSDTIYDLLQDADGSLWISTAAGLIRYRDGVFRTYTTAQGLPGAVVRFTYQDRTQRLWAMTDDGLAWWNGQRFFPVAGGQGVVALKRTLLAEDSRGRLWVGSSSGVFAVNTGGSLPRVAAHWLPGVSVEAMAIGQEQTLWVGSKEGLTRIRDNGVTAIALPHAPGKPEVTALWSEGSRLDVAIAAAVAITARVVQVDQNGSSQPEPAPRMGQDGVNEAGQVNQVNQVDHIDRIDQIVRDRRGTLWMIAERGVFRQQDGRWQSFAAGSDLATNRVLSVCEDREGDLWLGTDADGVNLLRDQRFTTYTTHDGLAGNYIRSVLQSGDGTLWIGTDGAGLNRRTPGGMVHYTTADGLSSNVILALAGGSGSDLWVGTPDGLNLLHPRGPRSLEVTRFTSADGLPDDFVRSLFTDTDGSLWIGTRHGLAHRVNRTFTSYSKMDGLGSDLIGAIVRGRAPEDREPDLWIGTSGGLTRLRAATFTNFTLPRGAAGNTVTAIAQGDGESLWLGTNGGGLYRFSQTLQAAFPGFAHSLPGTIYSILQDGSSHLWLGAPTGIYRVSLPPALAGGSPAVTAYGTADGMNIRECSGGGHPAAWKLGDGSLWFATLNGVSVIDPAHAAGNTVAPPVVIERFLVDDQPRAVNQELLLRPGANRLEIHYAGLSFQAPQKVQYRYRLQGFDHGWVDAGARRVAFYTNLPPGRYHFQVLAANGDGVWNSAGTTVTLRLLPRYYQTPWFWALIGVATLTLAYLAYRWRVRHVESQWSAVLAERGRMAREIHDTLAQGFVGISVQLEVVARLLSAAPAKPPQPAIDQLDQARALVRDSLAEARTSIWDLRSERSGAEDLPARLTRKCSRLAGGSTAKVYLQVKGTYRPVARKTEEELLRIGQEAVANAVRHAGAARIDVFLIYDAARMTLEIVDDGRGFAPLPGGSGPEGHYGIRGMHERAQQIGAVLHLESTPGAGTRITVEAPLKERLP